MYGDVGGKAKLPGDGAMNCVTAIELQKLLYGVNRRWSKQELPWARPAAWGKSRSLAVMLFASKLPYV